MNYFELHIGDYQKKTAHLSLAEHGAYQLMMQIFYATESPLPEGKVLYRMLRAESKAERSAIDSIVAQFWEKTRAGLVNGRASRELAGYQEFIEKQRAAGKASASKRNGGSTSVQPPYQPKDNDGSTTVPTKGPTKAQPEGQPNANQKRTSQSHLPSPTSHTHLNPTHTLPVSSGSGADSDAEKGSVCGNFTKIGREKRHAGK
jgi:uncharacterized protein YdaU (DUF1376 family)